jgi:uncharacterized protein DUF1501
MDSSGRCSRRDFLATGAALAPMSAIASAPRSAVGNCITLLLVGSPGHLDTWDMKPTAPADIRGPLRPIATNVPGIEICEHLPRMARLADRYALIRSLHHDGPPLHENGQRLMLTGRDFEPGDERPWFGSVISRLAGARNRLPPAVILPDRLGDTGAGPLHGDRAAWLGSSFEAYVPPAGVLRSGLERSDNPQLHAAFDLSREPDALRDRYGRNKFGQCCLLARRLIEHGVRTVHVNHALTVFHALSWDMHANGGSLDVGYDDYRQQLCPQLDQAFSALVLDLDARGLLSETVVAVISEMGRMPRLNHRGGRDHHPHAWTNLLAGGPIRGGQVIGATDSIGATVIDRPVLPSEFLASIYQAIGIAPATLLTRPDGRREPLVDARPIAELF